MFIARVRSKGKNGKSYESVLLRESFRIGSKVSSRTLAVLTKLPKWLVNTIESAIKSHGDDPSSSSKVTSPIESSPAELIASLNQVPDSPIAIQQAESFGALWLVKSLADKLGIGKALAPNNCPKSDRLDCDDDFSQIALWRVCARVLTPGISLLGTTRLVSQSAALRLFTWQESWCEDDLYDRHGAWLDERQGRIETSLWRKNHPRAKSSSDPQQSPSEDLFLYDVTSSYFEGTTNELSAFGYNRDGKKGKMQVVMGLLTDGSGDPCAIKIYSGETRDFATFGDALEQARKDFGCRHVVMVGDRGMIKSEQIKGVKDAGGHYISSLTKPQIQRLVREDVFQIELFDEDLAEVTDKTTEERYVLRRNPVRQKEIRASRRDRQAALEKDIKKAETYLAEHPGAKVEVQKRKLEARLTKLKLGKWLSIEEEGRTIKIVTDEGALREEEKLDGCYALRTNLNKEQCSAKKVHERYKALAEVEADFRTMKTGHLEVRPFFVIKEENTRAHALTAMLALKIRRHLAESWKTENLTVEEGLRQLETLSILRIEDGRGKKHEILPQPNELQARLLASAEVTLPKEVPTTQAAPVVTRKQLPEERKVS